MSAAGPPPVPDDRPPGVRRAERAVLEGGARRRRDVRRRRRGSRALLALLLVLVPIGAMAGAYYALEHDDSDDTATASSSTSRPSSASFASDASSTPGAAADEPRSAPEAVTAPRQPTPEPLIPAEPTPTVPLSGADAFSIALKKPPRAGLVFDVSSGEVLWRRRALKQLPIASLTKIMTALVVTERTRPREPVRITQAALNYTGSGVGLLPKGRRVRLETLMNGMLLVSGNDAAIALAVHVSGRERKFVRLMNQHTRAWGLRCTRFVDSHGLGAGNRSCPHDLAVLTRIAMERKRIRRIARRQSVAFRFPIKGRKLYLNGHNPLIRAGYPGAIGLKTGYTNEAGRCFVGVARRGGRTLGVVLLHSPDPFLQSRKLLDRAFATVGVH
jgi:D-alanyl-D-alanine carboxypeptidase (penicillin-binding protein 5/6)